MQEADHGDTGGATEVLLVATPSGVSAVVTGLQEATFLDQCRGWSTCPGERRTHMTFIIRKTIKQQTPRAFISSGRDQCHKQVAQNNGHWFALSSGGWEAEVKVSAGSCSLWKVLGKILVSRSFGKMPAVLGVPGFVAASSHFCLHHTQPSPRVFLCLFL